MSSAVKKSSQPRSVSNAPHPDIDRYPLKVSPDWALRDVMALMSLGSLEGMSGSQEKKTDSANPRVNYVLVMAEQELLGIFTERDVVKLSAQGLDFATVKVEAVMSRQLITLKESELENEPLTALTLFRQHRIRHVPILGDDSAVVGVVTSESLCKALQPSTLLKLRRVSEVMCTHTITASPATSVVEIAQLMTTHRISCVVIVADSDTSSSSLQPIGIITERDIVQSQTLALDLSSLLAQSVMSTPLVCLTPEDSLWEAHQRMQQLRVRRLVVADVKGSLTGILTQSNLLAVLNSTEMYSTVEILQDQVNQLRDEKVKLLEALNVKLTDQVEANTVELQSYQKRYQSTFEKVAVGIAHADLQGRFLMVNQSFCDQVGFSQAELLQKSFLEITHPAERNADRQQIQRLLQGEISAFSREKRYCRSDGSTLWGSVTVSLIVSPGGEPDYFIAVVEDINDRKRAEAALEQLNQELEARVALSTAAFRASERQYRMLFELAPDLLLVLNMKGIIRKVNTAAKERLGYNETELVGHPLAQFLATEAQVTCQQAFEVLMKRGNHRQELEFRRQDGTSIFVECSCTVITDSFDGEPYILAIQRDISDRKYLETRLRSSEQQMRSVFEAMHDLVLVCTVQNSRVTGDRACAHNP
ncbi:MAG: PAS domain S-box protein [Acaryochloridaceae cyanobacterium SU_2_1]|nr:PAS domain S-box protein [Acaryochloridaceae cyanobacterium SU_2_1]